jgi:hypothetical protein
MPAEPGVRHDDDEIAPGGHFPDFVSVEFGVLTTASVEQVQHGIALTAVIAIREKNVGARIPQKAGIEGFRRERDCSLPNGRGRELVGVHSAIGLVVYDFQSSGMGGRCGAQCSPRSEDGGRCDRPAPLEDCATTDCVVQGHGFPCG